MSESDRSSSTPSFQNHHQQFNTELAPKAIGPYSQACIFNERLIFVSGQIGLDPQTGQLVSGGPTTHENDEIETVKAQTHQTLKNLGNVLNEAGSGFSHVVKTTVLLTTMDHFAEVNKIYEQYFVDNKPARACFAVKQLPRNALVEIEAIAYKK
ncbi:hypothetical protein C9374_003528 [Naegleria lovaniensis]|uniref:Uncharacterized protein n=1 Tax=Naegleria lovaniensis TaxID=51637 RepID=A0AA88GT12_NAELO|nr:uncharacterized protein C9374_003528 [Naegleria lovaniensis]KAG2385713.1 hypothetical protein C9374_003528 [Naegleria lovaniensis]